MMKMLNEKGQVILILILVMTVALGIGLSVVQRSLSDISTATKVEQSSRAFSAAEAGIEKAIQTDSSVSTFTLDNNAIVQGVDKNTVPAAGQVLEYPPIGKEELAQVWLASPDTLNNYYTQNSLDIYWGSIQVSGREQPALEVKIIYQESTGYKYKRFYIDPVTGTEGQSSNNFKDPSFYSGSCGGFQITTSSSPAGTTNNRPFKCKVTLTGLPNVLNGSLPKLILLRARFLYNSSSQPIAVQPTGSCISGNTGCSLPPQARIFTATGISGGTQRKVQVFRLDKVVPPYFDYAIFSTGAIDK